MSNISRAVQDQSPTCSSLSQDLLHVKACQELCSPTCSSLSAKLQVQSSGVYDNMSVCRRAAHVDLLYRGKAQVSPVSVSFTDLGKINIPRRLMGTSTPNGHQYLNSMCSQSLLIDLRCHGCRTPLQKRRAGACSSQGVLKCSVAVCAFQSRDRQKKKQRRMTNPGIQV